MTLPSDYIAALEPLSRAFKAYEDKTGVTAVLVGGAATAIQTDGAFMSADFDVVASDDAAFAHAMKAAGFVPDGRCEWYHPDFPSYGVEQVAGGYFDGRGDQERLLRLTVRDGSLVLPSVEDLIADRLAQHAVASATDDSRLLQARTLLKLAPNVDREYLTRRISEEGGDINLLELD